MVQETNVQYAQVRKGKRLAVVTVSVVMFAVSVLTAVPARADASRLVFSLWGHRQQMAV